MFKYLNYKSKLFYLLSIVIVFVLPKGSSTHINGLPWSSVFEILLICSILPFIIFKNFNIREKKLIFYSLIILNILSIILLFSPKMGIGHKQFFDNKKNYQFIKTYETIWNKNYSSIQNKNWNKKTQFSIDWTARHPLNKDQYGNFKYFKNYEEFINLKLKFNTKFNLVLNEKTELIFRIKGIEKVESEFKYKKIDENLSKNLNINQPLNLEKGIYNFNFNIFFIDKNSKIEIFIKENNKLYSAFDKKLLFYDLNNLNIEKINLFKIIANLFDFLIISLVITIILFSIYNSKNIINLIILSGYFLLFLYLIK